MNRIVHILLVATLVLMTSCTTANGRYTKSGAGTVGGISGGFIGAGAGALIGAVIARGDIAASAVAGAAIGIPVGALMGIYYLYTIENKEINENQSVIDYNSDLIKERQDKINNLRRKSNSKSRNIKLNPDRKQEIYTGPSTGSSFR